MTKRKRVIKKTQIYTVTTIIKLKQELPPEVANYLRSLSNTKERYRYATDLVRAGWTLTSIANEIGVTREAVRIGVARYKDYDFTYTQGVPVPPKRVKSKSENKKIDSDIAERLLELHSKAKNVRYNHRANRKEAELLTKLIFDLYSDGYCLKEIANVLGLKQQAGIYSRLVRYGYIESKGNTKSVQKVKYRDGVVL